MTWWNFPRRVLLKLDCIIAAVTAANFKLEKIMSDLDTLSGKLDTLQSTTDAVVTDLGDLSALVKSLQGQTAPDLTAVIAKVDAIQGKLTGGLAANPDPGAPAPSPVP